MKVQTFEISHINLVFLNAVLSQNKGAFVKSSSY